ncbi:MAG TPA: FapA family protein [Spirochaetota bacterium]|jgi:hypothetical protein|nr:MAG: hypothetical protein BWX91_00905 [Spirochaetes bacterium ADurb.Bin133]HNZ25695.1 FapA family protein [Spirochaetota bacterium]HPY86659.1 FapA family protein [Spirochaetota bacterium]
MNNKKEVIIVAPSLDEAIIKGSTFLKIDKSLLTYKILESSQDFIKVKFFLKKTPESDKFSLLENIDGYFKINYIDGAAYLTVYPPKGSGKPVYSEEVLNRMKLLNIKWISNLYIKDIIDRATGIPEKLTDWPEGADFRATIVVKIGDDKMSASISIIPPKKGGYEIKEGDVFSSLKERNIVFGIDEEAIKNIIKNREYNSEFVVVRGIEPINPKPENLIYNFDPNPGKPFLLDEYDRINLKELNFIQNVKKGDVLAEVKDSQAGRDGINIFGEPIPFVQAEKSKILVGENAEYDEPNKTIISLIDGHVTLRSGIITVSPIASFRNVDYSTGNIDFDGSVVISGTISDGFTVKARGSIQVGERIGKIKLISGADVILKAGINGSNEGSIECEGDLYSRFIESSNIISGSNLLVEESIMNSHLQVKNNIILVGKRAELIGGKTVLGGSLRLKKLGSSTELKTEVIIGIDPIKFRLIDKLKSELAEKKDTLIKLNETKNETEKDLKSNWNSKENVEKLNKIIIIVERYKDDIENMERELQEAKNLLYPANNRYVIVEYTLFSGVTIFYGKVEYNTGLINANKIVLKCINNQIIESGFNYKEIYRI